MNETIAWESAPFGLDDPCWRVKVKARIVDGAAWPYRVEIRFKDRRCHHDEQWERMLADDPLLDVRPVCDCWDTLPDAPPAESLPPGGLSARMLRSLRLGAVDEQWRALAHNAEKYNVGNEDVPVWDAVRRAARRTAEVDPDRRFAEGGRGRPATTPGDYLRRLDGIAALYAQGKPQKAAKRHLRLSPQQVRATLEWARREGYWTRDGRGRRGQLTPEGIAVIEGIRR